MIIRRYSLGFVLVALLAGCSNPSAGLASSASASVPAPASAQATGAQCHYRAGGDLPDPRCTPGAYDPAFTVAQACGGHNQVRRNVLPAEKIRIARAYGVTRAQYQEADHLVPNALGGAQDDRNLWPEPRKVAKDAVEMHVLVAVCHGRITLRAAQTAFAHDWRTLR